MVRDPYSTRRSRVLYGLETTARVPINHINIDLQTHIMCFIVTFQELACHYGMRKRWNDVILAIPHASYNKGSEGMAVPLICPCKSQ